MIWIFPHSVITSSFARPYRHKIFQEDLFSTCGVIVEVKCQCADHLAEVMFSVLFYICLSRYSKSYVHFSQETLVVAKAKYNAILAGVKCKLVKSSKVKSQTTRVSICI